MPKKNLKLSYNSLFYNLKYDGMGFVYTVKRLWLIPFKVLGFATHVNILLNTVVKYKLLKGQFRLGLVIYYHVHKCNQKLNIRKTAPVFGLQLALLETLLQEMDSVIDLSKREKNVTFTNIQGGLIREYYRIADREIA